MLKKVLSAALITALSFLTCFAQNTSTPVSVTAKTQTKLKRADFFTPSAEPLEFNFEKELLKSRTKKNYLSGSAKTALWVSLFAAGVVTVIVLATRDKKDERSPNSPCGIRTSQIGVPCPPGCVCIQ